ncbi:hypothetical protein LTR99_003248 [Exophiala xenobiotica]|uniref:Glutathione S-transferase kappa n=1 Tax=Vermiconidia calcicola TaxID=1690605 RepID=A0AAV9Q9V0_9PEZI|nr:hypothetical protein LTR92_005990 [Exophiala xenobiotica]KAK5538914.1 hypothetical protein LTR25_004458 [Vermiconidia calcicola]KAK5540516.1 hypothetical protein LTR23_006198 [Chaetothyriales sp. CCFEE 6169]KAK5221728.1 hypothetical protein LTR72_005983 [Exophiala xenobiotica]KAK5223363.1 hypothetical protein LTR47_010210 [Exophiala xenobiotica]
MPQPHLTVFFDLHSPYSYLAFYVLHSSPVFRKCDVTYIPVLLVAFIKAIGLQPPWSSPNKVNYMTSDITRWSRDFNIPWTSKWPENYPFKATTLKVQRVLMACSLECPERYPNLLAALYRAFWVDKKGVQLPGVYEPIVVSVLGQEVASRVIERSTDREIKNLLKHNTDRCIASGAPGVPWLKAVDQEGREEYFWGFDHLGQLARHLGLEKLTGPHL